MRVRLWPSMWLAKGPSLRWAEGSGAPSRAPQASGQDVVDRTVQNVNANIDPSDGVLCPRRRESVSAGAIGPRNGHSPFQGAVTCHGPGSGNGPKSERIQIAPIFA